VYVLAGQSNMEGKAKVALLEYQVKQEGTRALFAHFEKDGKWAERDDVWIKFLDRKGPLTVGYGSPGCIGPELQFGWTVGDHHREPVLLVKPAWGGRSVWRDFRPPSAGMPPAAALEKILENARKKKPETTLEEIKAPFGQAYRDMMTETKAALADPGALFPALKGHRAELAGMMFFQGWNDMISAEYTAEYAENLAHLIRDVRKDLQAPALPVAVAEMGVDGLNANENIKRFKAAQAAAVERAEFKGTVSLVKTDVFWDTEAEAVFKKGWRENIDEWNKVGSDWGYHYYGSAKTLSAIGGACARALLEMEKK
jgi:Carbohydrate esterase, sialic acid-specific acetylesterase